MQVIFNQSVSALIDIDFLLETYKMLFWMEKLIQNQLGKLYVLIGRRTFSAAVMFANQLQMQTDAIFVGEATSQGPVFYGQPYLIELPNSKLIIGISSNHTIGGIPFDNRKSIEPDIKIEYTIEDFLNKKDPIIEKVLNINVEKAIQQYTKNNTVNIEGKY